MSRNCLKSIKIRDLDEYRDMDWRFRVTMRHMCYSLLVCTLAIQTLWQLNLSNADDGYVLVPLV